jgi:Holliday junction resolvase-like predicted endonuclease
MAGNNDISWDEIKALFAETNRKFQDTDRKFQDTDRKLDKRFNELYGLFSSQWGRLVESLAGSELVRTFEKRGIKIKQTAQRLKGGHKGQRFEFDIIARNGTEVVVVEVKTMLKSKHIQKFVDKMGSFKTWVKRYTPNNVYGAVAFLQADAGAEQMAENKGLFVIRATGDSAAIVNKADFVPRTF